MTPKTIQLYLPDGRWQGLRIAEVTSRNVQALCIPRKALYDTEERGDIHRVGLYFLIGELSGDKPLAVYVGEAENCFERLKQHDQKKGFWHTSVVWVSKTGSFTKAHVKYLESLSIRELRKREVVSLENIAIPAKPFVPEPMEVDLLDHFETGCLLMEALGFPVFQNQPPKAKPAAKPALAEPAPLKVIDITQINLDHKWICKSKKAVAVGVYEDDQFVVLKGSKAALKESTTANQYIRQERRRLIQRGILLPDLDHYIFAMDCAFPSPTNAAEVVQGKRIDGWAAWKNSQNESLGDVIRRKSSVNHKKMSM